MPNDHNLKVLSFEKSILEVIRGPEQDQFSLPAQPSRLLPSQGRPANHLEEIFKDTSLDGYTLGALRPPIHDTAILIPDRYRAALSEATQSLGRLARETGSHGSSKNLTAAALLLEENEDLMELLFTYRNLLHKG